MVLVLEAHRVTQSFMGARRQTGRSPLTSSGTVLLLYPRSLTQDVLLSFESRSAASLTGTRGLGTLAKGTATPALPDSSPKLAETERRTEERKALRESWIFGGCQSSANQLWPSRGPLYRVEGPSGFTQAAVESWKDH
jgi:hypothetical protein